MKPGNLQSRAKQNHSGHRCGGKVCRRALAGMLLLLSTSTVTTAAESSPAKDFAAASNTFAADLYGKLRDSGGNICVSPYSVSTALAMASAGARGDTETQMLAALHWTLPGDQLTADVAQATAIIAPPEHTIGNNVINRRRRPLPTVHICNSLWGASGLTYEQPFQLKMQNDFGAELHQVDFATDPESVRSQINQWASDATNKRIPQAVPPGMVSKSTRLMLVNAVYFKANWQDDFRESATKKQPFHLDGGSDAEVPLMQQRTHASYFENDQLQAAEMQYMGDFSMVVLLPKKVDGLKELESTFSADSFGKIVEAASPQLLDLHFPKFKMNCHYELSKPLDEMGMKQAFTTAADFSGISSSEKLMINAISHSTFIAVDEKGTEAAAVTAIGVTASAMRPHPEQPVVFRADHPFLFVIRNQSTGAILFMGRVVDPR